MKVRNYDQVSSLEMKEQCEKPSPLECGSFSSHYVSVREKKALRNSM